MQAENSVRIHQKSFGGRAPPGPAKGAYNAYQSLRGKGREKGRGKIEKWGKGEGEKGTGERKWKEESRS